VPYIPARPELVAKYNNLPKGVHNVAEYAAALEDLDSSVGQVLGKIDQLGIADNTYVFYVSDNGGNRKFTDNIPLNAGKPALLDGGIRVPYMVKGPGIQGGVFSDVAVSTTDLMATITSLVGYQGPAAAGNEGGDSVHLPRG
jgi:arylsulfatase A-like enzyme